MARKLAAILVSDMVGYSRLMAADEAGTLARLKALRTELIDPEIAAQDGRIVKAMGDGLLVVFDSIVGAVMAAAAVQKAMAAREAGVAPEQRIAFRVGIHLGDIIIEGMVFGQDETNLDDLISQLITLKEAADSSASELIVNIMPNDKALHARIIKVMDACAAANVKNMSFSMSM